MEYIAVESYPNLPSAHIACGMLQANGIEARVESENMSTLYGAALSWAPIEVLVPKADAERAMALLKEYKD